MLKIKIACVGKIKEKYFAEAVSEYVKRTSRFAEVTVKEVREENYTTDPSPAEIEKIIQAEGESLAKELKGYVICLAVEGKKLSSERLAQKLQSLKDRGDGEITFVIGGSHGISPSVKARADELISFSDMTFPHTLARVILTEQIYRAFMINSGSKYHK
jgi:23S rRNA (pseudouridine1915-N3)-methyltransferase